MRFGLIIITLLLFPGVSHAGAWLNKPGESTLIHSFYFFHFNQFADRNRMLTDQPDFMKYEYKPYYEYGISENYSAGLSPSFQHVENEYLTGSESGIDKNEGFVSVDVFMKRRIFTSEKHFYTISIMPMVEIPGVYKEETSPFFGKQESFWNIMLAFGINTYAIRGPYGYTNYGYINLETGIRSRFEDSFTDDSGASYKASLITSWPVTQKHSVNAGLDYTKSVTGYTTGPTSFLNKYGYDSVQSNISDVYKWNGIEFEFGYIYQFYGRNTGVGQGIKFSVLHRF